MGGSRRAFGSIVQLDREKTLCYSKIKVVRVIAHYLRSVVKKTLSFYDPVQPGNAVVRQGGAKSAARQNFQRLFDHIRTLVNATARMTAAYKLIVSIKGIGETTAAIFLGEVGSIAKFQHVRQLDAFAGLDVTERISGTSIHGKPHISKAGSKRLRTALYLPALSAMRFNPLIKRFVERIQQNRQLPKKVVICAVMRKLLHLIYGVLKTGAAFDANYGMQALNS